MTLCDRISIYSLSWICSYINVGPVNIVNLRDITTQSDLKNQSAVFSFDTHPKISPIVALGYRVQIQWSQLGIEFRSSRGFGSHTVYVPPGSTRNCRGTPKTTLELVGTGSYKLTVPTAVFDSGPLSIRVSVSLACLGRQSSCSTCYPWRYTSQASSSIDISAKKGEATDYLPHTQTVRDSIQHYTHINAQFMHTDGHPKRFRNTWR